MMGIILLALAGCAAWDGTWLFAFDPNTDVTGDCASEDTGGDGTVTVTGENYLWVDIYQTDGAEYVVLIDQALIGEPTGATLEASWSYKYESGPYTESRSIEFEGTMEGASMSGVVSTSQKESGGEGEYTCTTEYAFTATRNVSDRDRYAGS